MKTLIIFVTLLFIQQPAKQYSVLQRCTVNEKCSKFQATISITDYNIYFKKRGLENWTLDIKASMFKEGRQFHLLGKDTVVLGDTLAIYRGILVVNEPAKIITLELRQARAMYVAKYKLR